MILFLKSSCPPNKSTNPLFGEYAIALIVKSLLSKSSFKDLVKETDEGCLESRYSPSVRYVVISYPSVSPLGKTVTVPCFNPVGTTLYPFFLKRFITSVGSIEVVTS